MRYFFHIAYKGKFYHGWQRQLNVLGIQQVLEESLSKILASNIRIHGCGRTDAGVHADQYFFQIDWAGELNEHTVYKLNRHLPDDISVFEIIPVPAKVSVQHDAIKRTYNYYLHFRKSPFLSDYSTWYQGRTLDVGLMNQAAQLLTQYNDFRALCKSPDKVDHTRCNLSSIRLFENKENTQLRIEITANRFLRGMIRLIVAKLLDIGQGKLSMTDWQAFLDKNENPSYKKFAPPQGLHLSKIVYDFLERPILGDQGRWDLVE